MNASRGRFLSELRRSNAAGIHDARPSRSSLKRLAIQEGLDMSIIFDNDYPETDEDSDLGWDDLEPSPEDLKEIEEEEDYVPDDNRFESYDEDDYREDPDSR
jgi:hypothetical protein